MLFVGIDWSDRSLDFHLRAADGRVLAQGQVKPSVEGLAELFTALESHGPATEISIAIETSHGAWVQALLDRGCSHSITFKLPYLLDPLVAPITEHISAQGSRAVYTTHSPDGYPFRDVASLRA